MRIRNGSSLQLAAVILHLVADIAGVVNTMSEGVKLAEEKGLKNSLILVDQTAFVLNVENNKVITTVNQENLKGNVFTNIDGTVII